MVVELIDLAFENTWVLESGSEPSKVQRTTPCVIGGDIVNEFVKPASGMRNWDCGCSVVVLEELVAVLTKYGSTSFGEISFSIVGSAFFRES
jgi:hypothetical protein